MSDRTVWIALLRGVNVGGRNILPMAALRALLEDEGLTAVQTYIQSGNAVFAAPREAVGPLARRLGDAIETRFGFRPGLVLLSADALGAAIAACPFDAGDQPQTLHVHFLARPVAQPDQAAIDAHRHESEAIHLDGAVLYLHAPQGIGRSRLAATLPRLIPVEMTARNWRTVLKLRDMAAECAASTP